MSRTESAVQRQRREAEAKRRRDALLLIAATKRPLAQSIIHAGYPRTHPYQIIVLRRQGGGIEDSWRLYAYKRSGEDFALVFTPNSQEFYEVDAAGNGYATGFGKFDTRQLRDIYAKMRELAGVKHRQSPSWWQWLLYG